MIVDILRNNLDPADDYIYGFADLRGLLHGKFENFNYGILIGKHLDDMIVDGLLSGPTIEYLRHYQQINSDLEKVTIRIHTELNESGIDSMPVIPTVTKKTEGYETYMGNLYYDISHKMVATRSGLGWIGKTDLFISEKFGPRLRLTTILLKNNPGNCGIPVESGRCGKCNLCVTKCPAKAATGKSWNVNIHRDKFFNARKCREMCAELAGKILHTDERICGLCVSICPVGRKSC